MKVKSMGLLIGLLLAGLLVACGDSTATTAPTKGATPTTSAATLEGQTTRLGGGSIKSWVKLNEAGKPASVGLTFGEAALTNLPKEANQTVLTLPNNVEGLPFNHISVDWNPQGHEPAGIYDKPHFDLHFYMISQEVRGTIKPNDPNVAKQPAPAVIPTDYISPAPDVVPNMGVHWIDRTTPELNGKPFTSTLIYGFNAGNMAFIEPMITKAFFESKPNLSQDLKQPAVYPKNGQYYPVKYSVKYDEISKEYTVALEGLTLR